MKIWECLCEGFDSIMRGAETFTLFPSPLRPLEERLEELNLPKTDEEAFERDRQALESDRKKLFGK